MYSKKFLYERYIEFSQYSFANPEAIKEAVKRHLLPFINQLQFEDNEIYVIIQELTKYWILLSKKSITNRALNLKTELEKKEEINKGDNRDISLIACEQYFQKGIDHILVGMRKKDYIDKLLSLT